MVCGISMLQLRCDKNINESRSQFMQNVRLTFRVGEMPLLVIVLNMQTKGSHIAFITSDEIAMHPILLPKERNYYGIESRLQWWFNDDRKLPELLADIKKYGFFYGGQSNLRLDVDELD